MKKSIIKVIAIAGLGLTLSGCITSSPIIGGLYTNVKHSGVSSGGTIDNNVKSLRSGTSTCTAIFAVAFGDCSEEAAKKNAGITKVHSVTHNSTSVYIIYGEYTTTVTGE